MPSSASLMLMTRLVSSSFAIAAVVSDTSAAFVLPIATNRAHSLTQSPASRPNLARLVANRISRGARPGAASVRPSALSRAASRPCGGPVERGGSPKETERLRQRRETMTMTILRTIYRIRLPRLAPWGPPRS